MANGQEGLWVRFRVHAKPAARGARTAAAQRGAPPPRPEIRIAAISPAVDDDQDRAARKDLREDDARFFMASFIVRIEIVPAPPTDFLRQVLRAFRESLRFNIVLLAAVLQREVQDRLRTSPSPSPAGAPPGLDSGRLLRSIRTTIDDDGLGAAVGSDLDYARDLEFGTSKMAARPFLFPTFEDNKTRIEREMRRAATVTFDILTRQPVSTDRLGNPRLTGDPDTDAVIIWSTYFDRRTPPPPFGFEDILPGTDEQTRKIVEEIDRETEEVIRDSQRSFSEKLGDFVGGHGRDVVTLLELLAEAYRVRRGGGRSPRR